MDSGEWLQPFQNRGDSGLYRLNFLWQSGPVFVMDNHRAALWCWFQRIRRGERYGLLHIDAHSDLLYSADHTRWVERVPDLWSFSLEDYLGYQESSRASSSHLFRYDNYLSLFLDAYGEMISRLEMATQGQARTVHFEPTEHRDPWNLPGDLEWLLCESPDNWIVNVDVDYFVCNAADDTKIPFVSDSYIAALGSAVKAGIAAGKVAVVTVALSPEHCGGWEQAERLCATFLSPLEINFKLE